MQGIGCLLAKCVPEMLATDVRLSLLLHGWSCQAPLYSRGNVSGSSTDQGLAYFRRILTRIDNGSLTEDTRRCAPNRWKQRGYGGCLRYTPSNKRAARLYTTESLAKRCSNIYAPSLAGTHDGDMRGAQSALCASELGSLLDKLTKISFSDEDRASDSVQPYLCAQQQRILDMLKDHKAADVPNTAALSSGDAIEPSIQILLIVAHICAKSSSVLDMDLSQRAFDELLSRASAYINTKAAAVREIQGSHPYCKDPAGLHACSKPVSTLYKAISKAASSVMDGWSTIGRQSRAIAVARALFEFDEAISALLISTKAQMLARSMPAAAEVKPYTLTVDAIQALSTKPMHREAMAQIGSMIFTKNSRLLDMVPESVVTNLFEMLYRQRYYCNIISFMQHLPPNLVNADIVRTTLMALRKQQVSNNLGSRKYKARSREVQTRLNLHKAWEFVMSSELKDPIVSAAHKAIDALCKRSPTLLSSMHLTKLLEIELGSIPAELPIPRSMHLWLSNFQKHNIDAGVQAFTVIINAYMGHGDTQFAMQIFEQMQRGTLSLANPDGTSSSIHVPAPNEVTIASVASVWCRGKSLEKVKRVLGHIAKHGVPVSERLVTRVVSEMVDKGCLADAECIWREYGYVETRSVSDRASKRHVVNTRALAKLVLGFSRAESIHKALELFEIACESEHRSTGKAHAEIAHLTGLFNTVLRCALDATEPGPFSLRLSKRSISDVIGIALKYGVRYDTATYNVFLARLSRVAGEHMPKVGTGDEADANQELLKEAATTMHQLYLRMHSEGLAPDDTTLLHLIPAWTYLHQHDLAVENWLLSTQGRQSRKIERVKRHIMSKARLWNVESKTLELLEAQ